MKITERIKKNFEENKATYLIVGGVACAAVGVFVGVKLTNKVNAIKLAGIAETLAEASVWVPDEVSLFPLEMPITEIKEALTTMPNATILADALICVVDDVEKMYVRKI